MTIKLSVFLGRGLTHHVRGDSKYEYILSQKRLRDDYKYEYILSQQRLPGVAV